MNIWVKNSCSKIIYRVFSGSKTTSLRILLPPVQTFKAVSSETINSPTLYSQITGKYVSVESKIFPHILLLCSISYSCFSGLTINQHFIKPLQGEKCTSYLSVVDLSIVLPRVFFFAALCGRTIFTVTLTCTNANVTVAIDVLVVVYNKTWENRVILSLHGSASAGYSALYVDWGC